MLHEIRRWDTIAVIYSRDCETLRECVEAAVREGVDLFRACLDGASLDGARLDGASLDGASLDGARLVGARLDGASLDGASLDGARLVGARLVGASLDGASLDGAVWRDGIPLTRAPIIIDNLDDGWRVTILDAHMQIGCELHTFADWRAFDDARIVQMDGRRALKFWRRYGPALLALCAAREATP